MDQPDKKEYFPHKEVKKIDREADKSREKLDSVPEPGTDPLHEGP